MCRKGSISGLGHFNLPLITAALVRLTDLPASMSLHTSLTSEGTTAVGCKGVEAVLKNSDPLEFLLVWMMAYLLFNKCDALH